MGTRTTPRLILLNGPPGVGKSTLARRYADDHPLTLALEIDGIRGMLGSWLDDPQASGLAARRLALAMAAAYLGEGRDVIVPQLLTRREFVDQLRETAEGADAEFVELALMDERDAVLARANARTDPDGGFSARALVARQGNSFEDAYDGFAAALRDRPDAIVIGSYDELVARLG